MVSEWGQIKIGQVAHRVTKGTTPTTIGGQFTEAGIAFVKAESITDDGRIDQTKVAYIDDMTNELLSRSVLKEEDILFTIAGTIGRVAMVPYSILPANTNQAVAIIRPNHSVIEPRYLYYALRDKQRVRRALTRVVQSVQANLSLTELSETEIPLPSKQEQRAIAHILGTLDDKIELNRRMNQTLEAMAQALFKSWFVDFEPFRNQGMQDSPLGEIPVGWRAGKLEEIAVLHRESINPSDYPNEVFDHYSIPAFDESRMPRAETGNEIKSNKFRIPNGAVLISKLNPRFPRVWLPLDIEHRRSICSTEFLVVTPRGDSGREYFYSLFCSDRFLATFSTLVTGTSSSHQRVRPEDLMSIDLVIPPGKVISSFSDKVRPLLTLVNHNLAENDTLASSREALLPKLLSGEIRVKDAEKFVEEKM